MNLRSLSKDFLIYGVGISLTKLISILVLPITTRYLSVEEIGIIEMIIVLVNIGTLFCLAGIDTSVSFYYWDEKKNSNSQKKVLFTGLKIIALFSIIVPVVVFLVRDPIQKLYFDINFPVREFLFFILLIPSISLFLYLVKIYRIMKKAIIYVSLTMLSSGIFYLGVLFFLKTKPVILTFFQIKLLSYIVPALISLFILFIFFRPNRHHSSDAVYSGKLLKYGLPLLPLLLSSWLITNVDRVFLNSYYDYAVVGNYSVAYKLSNVLSLFLSSFLMVWSPYAMSIKDETNAESVYSKATSLFIILSLVLIMIIQVCSGFIINLFTSNSDSYMGTSNLFSILGVSFFLHSLFSVLSVGLNIKKKTYLISVGSFIAVGVNLILNFFLVPRFGMYGASLSSVAAYLITCIFIITISRRFYVIHYDYKFIAFLLAIFIGFLIFFRENSFIAYFFIAAATLFSIYHHRGYLMGIIKR